MFKYGDSDSDSEQESNLKHNLRRQILKSFTPDKDNVQHDISKGIDIRYNSINILLGQRGSGKTFNALNEVAAICKVFNKFHEFIYVSNNPNDVTYLKFKEYLTIPHVIIPYSESEEYIKNVIEYKQAYDEVKLHHFENRITSDCRNEICNALKVVNMDAKSLHTLILYDDAMEVFKKVSSKQFRWLLENRHTKTTYLLCLQDWKGISPELKANIDSIWFFGGYPRNRYTYIFNQLSCPIDRDELYEIYKRLSKRDCLIFKYYSTGTIVKIQYENCNEVVLYKSI